MSSPYIPPVNAIANRVAASSPGPISRELVASDASQDVSIRPMRLKVLYTFDDQNKTNCLARWPQVLDIRTAYLDESTQIGVIELKTCIQAIVSASPELVAKLGQDYTVYAYDYSEYETPLVGQGMLSWVLASSSSTPSAPALQSRTVVTGRVCKNILGLFSNGAQETLEVKLRLVPVPTCLQSEYIESMRKYRDLSKIMPEGFDAQAWTTFLQVNPGIMHVVDQSRSQSPANGAAQKDFGIEHVQQLLREGGASRNPRDEVVDQRRGSYPLADPFRSASPALSVQSSTNRPPPQSELSRTGSRASNLGGHRSEFPKGDSLDLGYVSNEDHFEEGPTKKRAKVTKAEWPTKSTFGKQPESLRVAASTAASVRVYQPTAIRPSANAANALEEPPRVPTPVPDPTNHVRRPLLAAQRSSLRRESYSRNSAEYKSPYAPSDEPIKPAHSAMTSPEESHIGSVSNTPADIGSSPPLMRGVSPTPSSPVLPTLPRHADSGFMSGSVDDLFEDDENRPFDDLDLQIAAQYDKRPDLGCIQPSKRKASEEAEIDNGAVQNKQDEQNDAKVAARSRTQARNASGSRSLNRTASSGSLVRQPAAASDPILPTKGALHRSLTWSGQSHHPASDAPIGTEGMEAPRRSKSRIGSSNRRKKAIQSKLATSIAAGEMPPFCDNCGAIETPTWRKAWSKLHSGTPEHVRISEEQGGIIAWQTLQTDENGNIKLFKIFKRVLLMTDEGFTEILLCNPCGLWLNNRGSMRPQEVWQRSQKDHDEKPKRGGRSKKAKMGTKLDQSDNNTAQHISEASSPMGAVDDIPFESHDGAGGHLPSVQRQRASSVQVVNTQSKSDGMTGSAAAAALQRAIQSSPARFLGTQHVPIEVDELTPKPTRRILFPSPRKAEEVKPVEGSELNTGKRSEEVSPKNTASVDYDQADKENQPPINNDDDLDHLFEDVDHLTTCPSTPPRDHNNSPPDLFKTPPRDSAPHQCALTTGDFFSSAAKAFLLQPCTPKRTPTRSAIKYVPLGEMTPFTAHLNQLLSEANASPSASASAALGSFGDFRSLPSLIGDDGGGGGELRAQDFDFSTFEAQDMLSTDVPMPSSPPVGGWFGVYEDPGEGDGLEKEGEGEEEGGLWRELRLGSSPREGAVRV